MKGATDSDRIFHLLVTEAETCGDVAIHQAYRKFCRPRVRTEAKGVSTKRNTHIPKAWVRSAAERQNGRCGRCGWPLGADMTGDHREPGTRGGPHTRANCDALHGSCNAAKGQRTLYEDAKAMGQTLADRYRLLNLPEDHEKEPADPKTSGR